MAPSAMERRAASRRKQAKDDTWWQLLIAGDFSMSCIFVALMSMMAEVVEALVVATGLPAFILSLVLTIAALIAFGRACGLFGGALFNPVHNVAFAAAGKGSLKLNAARACAQLLGAALGAFLAVTMLPDWLKDHFHKLPGGLKQGVSLGAGMVCEALLGFVLNLVVLASIESSNKLVAQVLPLATTVAVLVAGSAFTGPGLNPAFTTSFFIHFNDGRSTVEHALLYWAAPIAGALAGGLAWRAAMGPAGMRKPARKAHAQ